MTRLPGPLPHPPDDFASRKLPLVEAKGPLFRLPALRRDALHFGRTASWRFDDPERRYGVCYTATDIHGAFAETFTKALRAGLIAEAELRLRGLARNSCRAEKLGSPSDGELLPTRSELLETYGLGLVPDVSSRFGANKDRNE